MGTQECTAAYVWENADSVYVPSHHVPARSVLTNTGGFACADDADGLTMATFNPGFASPSVSGEAPEDFAFDPETGRFDARATSRNEAGGFGRAWVREWNAHRRLTGFGPR